MTRLFLATGVALLILALPPLAAQPQNKMAAEIASILNKPMLRASQYGIAFYDLDRYRMVYAQNEHKYFVAASTTKLLTEGTTLSLLGPDYRFTTTVYRDGPLHSAGLLRGNVILRAAGDPNLSNRIQPDGSLAFENEDHAYGGTTQTKAVPGDPLMVIRDIAKQISAHGIKKISGRVIVDDSLFPDTTVEGGSGTTIAPIVVNDNVIDVTLSVGSNAGDPVRVSVSPATAYVSFVNNATTGAAHSKNTVAMASDVADAGGNRRVTITGSFPQQSRPILYDYAVPSPRRFAETALTLALVESGVQVVQQPSDAPYDPAVLSRSYLPSNVIAEHFSPPLSEELRLR